MNLDIARKTDLIRRKVRTIIFDKQNRNLSDKIYDDLGVFYEKLNEEGASIPEKYYERVEKGLNKLYELNMKRQEELTREIESNLERSESIPDSRYQQLGFNEQSSFKEQITR
jgi:hypothetical protein